VAAQVGVGGHRFAAGGLDEVELQGAFAAAEEERALPDLQRPRRHVRLDRARLANAEALSVGGLQVGADVRRQRSAGSIFSA
jgi:hypothetical protein